MAAKVYRFNLQIILENRIDDQRAALSEVNEFTKTLNECDWGFVQGIVTFHKKEDATAFKLKFPTVKSKLTK